MDWEEMYDMLVELVGVNKDALELAFSIGGCNTETAERILFYYTGWHTFEGWLRDIFDDEEEED